ncbi:MAG: S1 RNA-binding domain-containing protein [Phycisphaerae bacterium]|nr:S1 RNA-binding domain-containing protein [Phycisphaerae bacterium]
MNDQSQNVNPNEQNETVEAPQEAAKVVEPSMPAVEPELIRTAPKETVPQEVAVPGPEINDELEREVAEALGDVSLVDMYGMAEEEPKKNEGKSSEQPIPGVLRGTVYKVADDGVFISGLGGRSEGFLPAEEFEEGEVMTPGDIVDVCIVRYDSKNGMVILSRNAATQQLLRSNLKAGDHVEVRVSGTNKGGLEVVIKGGLKAFMPVSQIDVGRIEDTEALVNQRMICEVTQVERGDKNIVVSRRNVMMAEREHQATELWDTLEAGQRFAGKVRSVADYGAFVDIGGVDGLVHVSEMAWSRVQNPAEVVIVGQNVDVVIKSIDKEKKKISLSMKQAQSDPWTLAADKYQPGSMHQAKVVRLQDFGAFAELEPGIDGLIPISEMTWGGRINHPSAVVSEGQLVQVQILKFENDTRRISMSMKAIQGNPWSDVESKYSVDQTCTGTVVRLADFGAFVELEPGIDGLVHISQISDLRIERVSDALKKGQEVQVRIQSIDTVNKKISLTMKKDYSKAENQGQASANAEPAPDMPSRFEAPKKAVKRKKKNLRGGLSW